jgi:hypothetical protein
MRQLKRNRRLPQCSRRPGNNSLADIVLAAEARRIAIAGTVPWAGGRDIVDLAGELTLLS